MSREAELYKDKIEVSLDGRQIFYLFFGGAVIVGLVFVLGVMVGRRVEARGHVDRARVAATVDPLAALDRLEGGTALSFHGALRGGETPASDVEKQIAAMQRADAKAAARAEKPAAKVEPKRDDKRSAEAKEIEDRKKAEEPLEAKKREEQKREEQKREEQKREDKKREDKKAEAKAAEAKDADVAKQDDNDDSKAEKKPKYTLQLSAFQDRNEAQAYLDTIKSAGYQAYVTEGAVDGKQYYRVRMGSYRSMDAANEAKTKFEKSSSKTALVTRL